MSDNVLKDIDNDIPVDTEVSVPSSNNVTIELCVFEITTFKGIDLSLEVGQGVGYLCPPFDQVSELCSGVTVDSCLGRCHPCLLDNRNGGIKRDRLSSSKRNYFTIKSYLLTI